MLALLNTVLQFIVHASDPHWTCELAHRDPGIAGTSYLYCSQTTPDGIEVVTVGRFIPDAPARREVSK